MHTRISDQLADDIRRVAEDLRVPVSNLVRNVLEEAFSVVERVSEEAGELLDDVIDEAERARFRMHDRRRQRGSHRGRRPRRGSADAADAADATDDADWEPRRPAAPAEPAAAASPEPVPRSSATDFSDVVAWQRVVLNRAGRCAEDQRELPAGDSAYVGMTAAGLSDAVLCPACMQARHPGV